MFESTVHPKLYPPTLEVVKAKADFGTGLNSIYMEAYANTALDEASQKNQISIPSQPKQTLTFSLVENEETFLREIEADVSGAGTIAGVKIEGSASISEKMSMSEKDLTLIAMVKVDAGSTALDKNKIKLKTNLEELMESDPEQFYKQFGTHFVSEVLAGAEFTMAVKHTFSDMKSKLAAQASLGVTTQSFEAAAKMSTNIEKSKGHEKIQIEINQTGYLGTPPTFTADNSEDVKKLLKYMSELPQRMKAETVAGEMPRPHRVSYTRYSSIAKPKASQHFDKVVEPTAHRSSDLISAEVDYKMMLSLIDEAIKDNSIPLEESQPLRDLIAKDLEKLQTLLRDAKETLRLAQYENAQQIFKELKATTPNDYEAKLDSALRKDYVHFNDTVLLGYKRATTSKMLYIAKKRFDFSGPIGRDEYFATLGEKEECIPMTVLSKSDVHSRPKAVQADERIVIETEEDKHEKYASLKAGRDHLMYYVQRKDESQATNWFVQRVEPGDGPITYGEPVKLVNAYWNQSLEKASDHHGLTTVKEPLGVWVFMKPD